MMRGTWSPKIIVIFLFAFTAMGLLFWHGLAAMVEAWSREEYSHGYLIPFVAIYLFARRLGAVDAPAPNGRWLGAPLALLAVGLGIIGNISNIADLTQYGFLIALVALLISFVGLRASLLLWAPVVYLVFMIPLPQVLYLKLSSSMQLLSSQFGTQFIAMLGIPVLLDGNVIDLGVYKLQVVEACSGLRYLFPLMSFGFLFGVLYRGPTWHKILLFLSTIPITIFLNSFRIGVIGVLVDRYGISQAEGFLHFFEGWIIFIACIALLFGLAYFLMRISRVKLSIAEALDLDFRFARPNWPAAAALASGTPPAFVSAVVIVALGGVLLLVQPFEPKPVNVARSLALFPDQVGEWRGRRSVLPEDILEVLGADDYLVANYRESGTALPVNLFIAYYRTQSHGRAVHSPEICVPGSGWEITSFKQSQVENVGGKRLGINRAIIQKGVNRQLVYYWFEQRGRQLTNEYLVKWYILWDGVTRGRTDGSIVRLVVPILKEGGEAVAEKKLAAYVRAVYPNIPKFLPQ